jgi:methylmalonyl-CoA epimerase
MKAVLDHVGIAVGDIDAALAFYRDALGLEIEAPENVAAQRVRAHVVPVGESAIELLEATAPDSPIAKFLQKRGPGLHHITLRVDDIGAALTQLRDRGVKLIDEQPRPGAQSALVAFIHPSAAHGVLVELTQAVPRATALQPERYRLGELSLVTLHDGLFRLDGGAMFGVVPRTLWSAQSPPDDRNRIQLATRPLLVETGWGRLLIDCGIGDKMDAKQRDIYAVDRAHDLDQALAAEGLSGADIDLVLATHLHFDHFGGATVRRNGRIEPRFERARYLIRRGEWHDATHPHERNRASYIADDFVPLESSGVLDLFDGDLAIGPGVRVARTGGHCAQHQIVFIESAGKTAVFTADLIPTVAHIRDAWIMGYDLYPMDTLAFKKQFIRDAIDREYLVFFEHDPLVAAGYIRERNGKRFVDQVL